MAEHTTGPGGETGVSAVEVSDEETFDRCVAENRRVLVEFYADWCGPCQRMGSTVEAIAEETDGMVLKVDIEELPQVGSRYNVKAIPTFIAVIDGDPVDRYTGITDRETLLAAVE